MYGWRGRVGLMLPFDNAVIEPEFSRTMPPGVSGHVIRTTKTDRIELAEESLLLAPTMQQLRVNIALYCCNASTFLQGKAWHDDFLKRFAAAAGVPTESANSSMVKLMKHRKMKRIAVVSPYPEWLKEPLRKFLTDSGFDVVNLIALGLEPPDINMLGPEHSYRYAKQTNVAEADGILIIATNFRTLEVLSYLEEELDKPVVSSNQALVWMTHKMLGIPQGAVEWGERKYFWPVIASN